MRTIEIQAGDRPRHIAYLRRGCSPPVRAAVQPGDWIEAFERDAKRMLNYLLDVWGRSHSSSISAMRARSDLL